ncbi:hypothetical protein F5Y19DRAFT_20074 [Xylariaceae sp. FL1651]|nr:hypothetical protein F5Y19DRAFT_20074 [Xylariaceae sp. FL1651]
MSMSSRRSRSRGVMPAIAEDDYDSNSPGIPRRSSRRAVPNSATNKSKHSYLGYHPPPPYSANTPSTTSTPLSPPPPKDTRPGWYVKRGGWFRLTLLGFLTLIVVAALVVGLVLGLRRKGHSNSNSPPTAPEPPILFPAGSYSFMTALWNTSTACTTNSAAFRCYPFATYNSSSPSAETDALATFLWTISERANSTYNISTAPNPFVPQFSNVSLNLEDGNQDTERLVFELGGMVLEVVPAQPITGSGDGGSGSTATKCYFNDTTLSATIWTRKPAEYPANLTTSVDNMGNGTHTSENFDPWPYAVEISQVAGAGVGVPDCRDADGNEVGNFEMPQAGGDCGCWYRNFDL